MQDASAHRVGRTVNGYEILGKLGAGGMGVVYKARDIRLQRTVALKFLPDEINADPRAREMFLQEARAASALDHPNIGTIHGIEESAEGHLFIVMAYYEGETLSQKLLAGPIAAVEAAAIGAQIAKGLAAAHEQGIVHRDIKPSNIILTAQGLVKIVDFGLARVIQSASMTQTASISGTASYMSPEQAQGKQLDHRTDLWSFGATLYTMLTCRLPFQGESTPSTLFAIVHSAPAEMDPATPAWLQRIVYRALAKDRDQRYPSAAEMLADFQPHLGMAIGQADPTLTARSLARYRELAAGSQMMFRKPGLWSSTWVRVTAVVLALVTAIALLVTPVRQRMERLFTGAEIRHIAVLPITVIGGDANDSALADGLMDSLTGKLSELEVGNQSLWVVPASEVRRRKITDPPAARKTFATNLVVMGSLHRDGQAIRLVVNLIDTGTLRQLGSGQFVDRGGDFSAIQDSAVAKLANLMDIPITREMLHNTGGSVQPAAYEAYLKALGAIQRYDKPGNLDTAIKLLQGAVETDPKFALAYASMGEAYLIKYKLDTDRKWLGEATANCQRALQLNDQLAPVYATMGRIHAAQGNYDLALQELQRAVSLEPHNADAQIGISDVYENQGRIKDAEATLVRAAALRPDYFEGYNRLGLFYKRQKRYEEAVQQFQRAIALTPDNVAPYQNLGSTYIEAGKLKEAAAALEKAGTIAPSYGVYANLGQIYYRQQQWAEAAAATEKALKINDKDFRVWINAAVIYGWLDRKQDADAAYTRALPMVEAQARLKPQDAGIQGQLAELYARAGRKQDALQRIETALALDSKDFHIQECAAEVQELTGGHDKAVKIAAEMVRKGYPIANLKLNHDLLAVVADPQFPHSN
jgi:eukaryotic-like serine/threonine-protein kinase